MKKSKVGIKTIVLFAIIFFAGFGAYNYYKQNKRTTTASIYDTYKQLENYMISNGYKCDGHLLDSGNACKKNASVNTYEFYRFDDGVQYISTSKNYKINLTERQGNKEYYIQTFENALPGYQNKKYICETENDSILGQLIKCKDEETLKDAEVVELDNEVYIMAVRTSLMEIDNILENSGYNASKLVSVYKWVK